MEELKARILEIVEDYEEGISVLDNDMAQAGIDPKSDFVNTIVQLLEERECRAREEGYVDGVEHRKRRAKKYFMDGKVGDDFDLLDHADSTYKLTTK